jgi:seryl-tRNA synthetase
MQAKKDATVLQEKSKSMKAEITRAEEAAKEAEAARDKAVTAIGNLVHDSVPVSKDEACIHAPVHPCLTHVLSATFKPPTSAMHMMACNMFMRGYTQSCAGQQCGGED